MTQEEKQLLLKDLCARLPYGVIYHRIDGANIELRVADIKNENLNYTDNIVVRECKPYLRPMSSMTEKEKSEFFEISGLTFYDDLFACKKLAKNKLFIGKLLDYLNAHHFDYNGLIEKGLAIEVTEENNPYKD